MITKDTSIMDALRLHPRARDVFQNHGMGCIGCMGATRETIEMAAKIHDLNLDVLVEELNLLLTNK